VLSTNLKAVKPSVSSAHKLLQLMRQSTVCHRHR